MRRGKQNFALICEDAFPFLFRIVKQPLNLFFQFIVSAACVTELKICSWVICTNQLIIQFGKDQLKDFFKGIHTGTGKNFILHFLNQRTERFFLGADFVFSFQIFVGKFLVDDIRQFLCSLWNIADFFKEIGVFSIVAGNLLAVCPDTNRRTSSIAIGFQLFLTIGEFGLFQLDNDIRHHRTIFVHDGNICSLYLTPKVNRSFQLNSACHVSVVVHQHVNIELTNSFFGSKFDILVADCTSDIGNFSPTDRFHKNARLYRRFSLGRKKSIIVCSIFKKFIQCHFYFLLMRKYPH